jgi:hypothetical protein
MTLNSLRSSVEIACVHVENGYLEHPRVLVLFVPPIILTLICILQRIFAILMASLSSSPRSTSSTVRTPA